MKTITQMIGKAKPAGVPGGAGGVRQGFHGVVGDASLRVRQDVAARRQGIVAWLTAARCFLADFPLPRLPFWMFFEKRVDSSPPGLV